MTSGANSPFAHITAKWWRVPAAEVPGEREARIGWLYDHWEQIDAWIGAQRQARTPDRAEHG